MEGATSIHIAQGLGVFGSAFAAGLGVALSLVNMPSIMLAEPHTMARQWKRAFDIGKAVVPVVAVGLSSVPYAYLAYSLPRLRNIYITAAVLPALIVPYTILFMSSTNTKLMARAQIAEKVKAGKATPGASAAGEESTAQLVQRWANLNYVRTLGGISAAVVGYWATTL